MSDEKLYYTTQDIRERYGNCCLSKAQEIIRCVKQYNGGTQALGKGKVLRAELLAWETRTKVDTAKPMFFMPITEDGSPMICKRCGGARVKIEFLSTQNLGAVCAKCGSKDFAEVGA